jgi:hypothetical protein
MDHLILELIINHIFNDYLFQLKIFLMYLWNLLWRNLLINYIVNIKDYIFLGKICELLQTGLICNDIYIWLFINIRIN